MKLSLLLLGCLIATGTLGRAAAASLFTAVECEGSYSGHLQGLCTNGRDAIYWSWTTKLVKTDAKGKILRAVDVPTHHGDLCLVDGKVYVAVNLGKFNEPAGQEDSWVYVFDGESLAELARHRVPELVHGAGGIAYHDGTFVVVGGLPPGVNENYLYEYDEAFRFKERHVLASGYTYKGIQTATYWDGAWWLATYGETRYLMRADEKFKLTDKWIFDASLGIQPIGEGRFLIGSNRTLPDGRHVGRADVFRVDARAGLVPQ